MPNSNIPQLDDDSRELLATLAEAKETLSIEEYAGMWYGILKMFKVLKYEPSDELCDAIMVVFAEALRGDQEVLEEAMADSDRWLDGWLAQRKLVRSGGYHAPMNYGQLIRMPYLVTIHLR